MKATAFLSAMRWLFIRSIEMVFVFMGVVGIFAAPEDDYPHFGMALLVSKVIGAVSFYILYRIDKSAFPQEWADDKLDEI